jgi:dihydroceramidase
MTRYIGEFINTLTNLVYSKKRTSGLFVWCRTLTSIVIYAIHGIRSLRQKKNASAFRAIPYWGLMAVGICSAAFHGSLKYHTQMSKQPFCLY